MNAFGNAKPTLPNCFVEKVRADLAVDTLKRQNPIDFKALKEAKEDQRRWRSACERFISEQKAGPNGANTR